MSMALVYATNYFSNQKHQVEISKHIDMELAMKNTLIQSQDKFNEAQVKISELEKINEAVSKANSASQANYKQVSDDLQKANIKIGDLEGQLKRQIDENEKTKNELKDKVQKADKTIEDLKKVLSAHNITSTV